MWTLTPAMCARRLAVLCLFLPVFAAAEERPQIEMVWTQTPPTIDGDLSDEIWQRATLVDDFTQVTPVQGAEPSQRTVVRILSDSENLYFAVRCYDTEVDQIVANRMGRDDFLFYDDRFQIALDPFHDRLNGYSFEVNPLGARRDVLIEGKAFSLDWDTIWSAKTQIDAKGWSAEIRIPYQSLNYDPNGDTWGINFSRGIRRNNEEDRFADPYPQRFLSDLGNAGIISNMYGTRSGIGLDISPGFTVSYREDPMLEKPPYDLDVEPSGNIFYKVLPSLTVSGTGNTNFGETEADTRQVNFSRFAIAFPEKRDFFLQDALIFEFAELTDDFSGLPANAQPFFSRRIGVVQPDPEVDLFESVNIVAGGKVTGRVDRFKVGFLHTLVDSVGSVNQQNLTVGRVAMNLLEESTLGVIATNGDPFGEVDNTVVGSDFVYRNTNLFGDKNLVALAWFQQSFTRGADGDGDPDTHPFNGSEHAYSLGLSYPNDRFNWDIEYKEIAGSFNPALGFLNRASIRQYAGKFRYRTRLPGYIRTIDNEFESDIVTNLNDERESMRLRLQILELENELAGRIEFNFQHRFEHPIEVFDRPGGVRIDDRARDWEEGMVRLTLTRNRPFWGQITIGGGQYFGGTRIIVQPEFEWRPSPHFLFGIDYDFRQIDIKTHCKNDGDCSEGGDGITLGGTATSHVTSARVGIYFTPDISWITLVQWDNVTNALDVNSRLRWIIEDGREIFIVLNQGYQTRVVDDIDDGMGGTTQRTRRGFARRRTERLVKIAWSFRF
jgi:hypothetical protein